MRILNRKGIDYFFRRVKIQGLYVTVLWIFNKGFTFFTGVPNLKYGEITDRIIIGPCYNQVGKDKLLKQGIKCSVNLQEEFDDKQHNLSLTYYCYLPTKNDKAPSLEQLFEGIAFIDEMIEAGEKIYIHCKGGIGRAPTLVIAYFVSKGVKLNQAILVVKKVRPFIFLTTIQIQQLTHFEKIYSTIRKKETL